MKLDDLIAVAREHANTKLITLWRRVPFTVSIDGQRFVFHTSRGSQVKESFSNAKKVIACFNETQSYAPHDYKGTTHSASYLLTLIALARGETPGDGTPRHTAR